MYKYSVMTKVIFLSFTFLLLEDVCWQTISTA